MCLDYNPTATGNVRRRLNRATIKTHLAGSESGIFLTVDVKSWCGDWKNTEIE